MLKKIYKKIVKPHFNIDGIVRQIYSRVSELIFGHQNIIFQESKLAHYYLDGLKGIEIGGSAQNQFGLDTLNVDKYGDMNTRFKVEEEKVSGLKLPVDIVAPGDELPFDNNSFDFVLASHVIEHFFDPIKALKEWKRVARQYIFLIVPHKERTFDHDKPLTTLQELIDRHNRTAPFENNADHHQSFWITQTFLNLLEYLDFNVIDYQDTDDKVGNGFTVVIQLGHKK